MSSSSGLRFLRPYLHNEITVSSKAAYIRFFNSTRCLSSVSNSSPVKPASAQHGNVEVMVPFQVQERMKELKSVGALTWPRMKRDLNAVSIHTFIEEFSHLKPGEHLKNVTRTTRGRIRNIRTFGTGLVFLDIEQERCYIQVTLNWKDLSTFCSISKSQFSKWAKLIRRGDIIECTGTPYLPAKGLQQAISAIGLPQVLSPCLNTLPYTLLDQETRIRNRHLDLLASSEAGNILKARSEITQSIRNFLLSDRFIEVQTPIIADKAGGAVAKPFTTHATEFPEKQLALRIAPELWLKRLIVGGMDRVFEIGPAFRNEGLDATHNPEFTTCEFYKSFTDLEELMKMTEDIFGGIVKIINGMKTMPTKADMDSFKAPFKRIAFIPAIEEGLKQKLPDLDAENAEEALIALFKAHDIPLPTSPTLPRLLDRLASIYIEPQCEAPTFITYHPACMAPLSKSFFDEETRQYVSARAELFIQQREIANMYEEENSPLEQRKKFIQQLKWKDDENAAHVDESYLEALEWGMPPTGGWGMGIDRLVMLLTGAKTIRDVLAFGNLRNVVNLGVLGTDKLKPSAKNTADQVEDQEMNGSDTKCAV